MKAYAHGGDVDAFAALHGFRADEVIDFSANINFLKPWVESDFGEVPLARYPEPTYRSLREKLAARYNAVLGQLELFNGASSAIFSLFRFLRPRRCVLYAPIYLEYKKAAEVFGYEMQRINRFEAMSAEVPGGALVVFVNPSTPDGTLYNMEPLLEAWKAKGCSVVVDESFLDFTGGESAIKYLSRFENLYILKSMTKFYASAGVRVGAVIADETAIASLRSHEPAWKLSALDCAYMERALQDEGFEAATKVATARNREMLSAVLKGSGLFAHIYPSSANFILAKLETMDAAALQAKLAPYKILIRNCENFDFLDSRHVRFAVKDETAINALETAFKRINP